MNRISRIITNTLAAALLLSGAAGCSSTPQTKKPAPARTGQEDVDMLDTARPSKTTAKQKPSEADAEIFIPTASEKLSITLDGKPDEWDLRRKARTFASKRDLEDGATYWRGPGDLSLTASVRADDGHVYFWLQVTDDVVLDAGTRKNPLDGVALWLHEPRLKTMLAALPGTIEGKAGVGQDVGILFTPDGKILPASSRSSWPEGSVQAHVAKTATGYAVEVAVSTEVFAHVASLPLNEIAFRVEAFDGDEADRPGVQTVLSMYPRSDRDAPRFASYNAGMLPRYAARDASARPDGMGYWARDDKAKAWTYTSFEVLPQSWGFLTDHGDLGKTLAADPKIQGQCNVATHDLSIIEAYESRGKGHRALLVACAGRLVNNACPKSAKTQLLWVHLKRQEDRWRIEEHASVFKEPLTQCLGSAPAGQPVRSHFTFFPLEFVNAHTWAVGWQESNMTRDTARLIDGVTLINARADKPRLATLYPFKSEANDREREVERAKIYFINVDDQPGLDICEIQQVQVQECRRLNAECKPVEHRTTRLSRALMWKPADLRYEPYMLSRHANCKTIGFDPSTYKGYVLLQIRGRIGLLPLGK